MESRKNYLRQHEEETLKGTWTRKETHPHQGDMITEYNSFTVFPLYTVYHFDTCYIYLWFASIYFFIHCIMISL